MLKKGWKKGKKCELLSFYKKKKIKRNNYCRAHSLATTAGAGHCACCC